MPHRLPHHPVHRHSWAGLSDRRWRREPSGSSVTPCETARGREKCGAETGLLKRMRVAHQGDLRCRRYWLQMPFVPSPPMDRTPQPPRTPTQAFHRLLAAINLHTQRSHRRSPAESTLRVHIASQLRAVSPSRARPCSPPVVGTYGRRVEAQKVAETAALCLSSFSLTLSRMSFSPRSAW